MDASRTLNLDIVPVSREPFEHVLKNDFVNPEIYAELVRSFPQCPPSTGPTGFSCYWGDPEYDRLITTHDAWKAFFQAAHSDAFIHYCIEQFRDAHLANRCLIDLSRATYVPYQESRQDKQRRHIRSVTHLPHELWVRLDIHQGHLQYRRRVHLDHRRRLISLLVYFCDSQETGMTGGDLVLHTGRKYLWHPEAARISPRHNLMVCFPCSKRSLHSVPRIRALSAPRSFVQIQVSSSTDAWPT